MSKMRQTYVYIVRLHAFYSGLCAVCKKYVWYICRSCIYVYLNCLISVNITSCLHVIAHYISLYECLISISIYIYHLQVLRKSAAATAAAAAAAAGGSENESSEIADAHITDLQQEGGVSAAAAPMVESNSASSKGRNSE
jgi:hypothetical protein